MSQLTGEGGGGGAKMKNLDRRFYVKTSFRFIFYLYKTLNGNQNN